MVFQSYALYPSMTVKQNITFGMESRGVPKAQQAEAVARVAGLLQIEPLLARKPAQLSGGQRQRVAMGRALVRDPLLFLFDEPLSNLDAQLRVEMRTEIKKLHQRVGKTTVYVTHDQIEAMTLASRIAVMHKGELQQFAEPKQVYDRPANMFVAGFMGSPAINFIPAEVTLEGGPAVMIATAGGEHARLPMSGAANAAAFPKRVILGLRPQYISRHDAGATGRRADYAMVKAPIEVVEPTGAETMGILRFGHGEVTARFDAEDAPRVGETVTLAIDMSKACLFDSDTRKLLN
jgi:multiple sugar transport system ATP-binding protein